MPKIEKLLRQLEGSESIASWRQIAKTILTARLEDENDLASRESDWILRHVLDLDAQGLLAAGDRALSKLERQALLEAVTRRAREEPLQYILENTDFMGIALATNPHALIPRPETEGLVLHVLNHLPPNAEGHVADIGTGSGCIALGILSERPRLRAIGVDSSAEALSLAKKNAEANGLSDRFELILGDLLVPLQESGTDVPTTLQTGPQGTPLKLLAIVSNPPYVAFEEKSTLPPEVVDFEPHQALFSSDHGLHHIKQLIAGAPDLLQSGGLLALEIGETQGEAVRTLLEPGPWKSVRIEKDLAGRIRYALAIKSER